ncbi:UNVERIFIED_CONTAM: hypothetical protein NCL1_28902 [Trichonephila clavipes]
MQLLSGVIYHHDNARSYIARVSQGSLRTVTTLPLPVRYPDLSPIEHIRDHLESRVWHPTRTRGKVTANMEQKVSRHHTEPVCLNVRSNRTWHSR